jgi:hypothetical protein
LKRRIVPAVSRLRATLMGATTAVELSGPVVSRLRAMFIQFPIRNRATLCCLAPAHDVATVAPAFALLSFASRLRAIFLGRRCFHCPQLLSRCLAPARDVETAPIDSKAIMSRG